MKERRRLTHSLTRRGFIEKSTLAATSAIAAISSATGAATVAAAEPAPPPSPEPLPCGRIGKASISRLLLGGNLIGGWMHARDLKYSGALFRAYVTEQKLMETLHLGEQQGIERAHDN